MVWDVAECSQACEVSPTISELTDGLAVTYYINTQKFTNIHA
jgi:hypothetical protein